MNNNMFSKAAVWLVIALVLFTVFKQFDKPRVQEGVTYSQFMTDAKNGKIKAVVVQGRNLAVTPSDGQKYQIASPRRHLDGRRLDEIRCSGQRQAR